MCCTAYICILSESTYLNSILRKSCSEPNTNSMINDTEVILCQRKFSKKLLSKIYK